MKNLTSIALILVTAGLVSCGDNEKKPDAAVQHDAPPDTTVPFPAAPTLGAQIDRMGRPAVNTALNAAIDDDPTKTAKKDAYNHATDPAMWKTTVLDTVNNVTLQQEFKKYIAIYDVLDKGMTNVDHPGCGNAAGYASPAGMNSYTALATILSDDELFVDTTKGSCNFYLTLEVEVATAGGVLHSQCGGRMLNHDVVDTSYSMLAAGTEGFNLPNFTPKITDGAEPHTDYLADFPYLGPPHTP